MGVSKIESTQASTYIDDIHDKVTRASNVIVPLSPISVFAAEIAHWLKETRKVDMYPARMTILEANQKGEIDDAYVEQFFQQ